MVRSNASPKKTSPDDARRFACHVARLLADSRCEDVIVQDLSGLSPVTDMFVIGTATSQRMLKSLADDVRELAREEGYATFRLSGDADAQWVVIDLIDVVVHLFEASHRSFYDLESLWADATPVDWASRTQPGQFAMISASKRRAAAE